jgi:hypothetical protein
VTEPDDNRTFCSALVSTAFRAGGAPEFSKIDPMKTTPATLEKSAHFVDVTSQVFMRILSPNNIEEMSALDGDRIPSPMFGHMNMSGVAHVQIGFVADLSNPNPAQFPSVNMSMIRTPR